MWQSIAWHIDFSEHVKLGYWLTTVCNLLSYALSVCWIDSFLQISCIFKALWKLIHKKCNKAHSNSFASICNVSVKLENPLTVSSGYRQGINLKHYYCNTKTHQTLRHNILRSIWTTLPILKYCYIYCLHSVLLSCKKINSFNF